MRNIQFQLKSYMPYFLVLLCSIYPDNNCICELDGFMHKYVAIFDMLFPPSVSLCLSMHTIHTNHGNQFQEKNQCEMTVHDPMK